MIWIIVIIALLLFIGILMPESEADKKLREEQTKLWKGKWDQRQKFYADLPGHEKEIIRLELLAQQSTDLMQRVELLYQAKELKEQIERSKQYYG
jgi:hypothetical protein